MPKHRQCHSRMIPGGGRRENRESQEPPEIAFEVGGAVVIDGTLIEWRGNSPELAGAALALWGRAAQTEKTDRHGGLAYTLSDSELEIVVERFVERLLRENTL